MRHSTIARSMKLYLVCVSVTTEDIIPNVELVSLSTLGCSNLRHAIKVKSTIKGGLINAGYPATSSLEQTQTIAMARVLWTCVISFFMIKHREASQIHRQTIMVVLMARLFLPNHYWKLKLWVIVLWDHFQIDNNQNFLQIVFHLWC